MNSTAVQPNPTMTQAWVITNAVGDRASENRGKAWLFLKFRVVELYFCIEFAQLSIIQWIIQRETNSMNTAQTVQLINLLSKKRIESGLSVAEVARRAHVNVAAVWRIEQGMIATPRAESLIAIGEVLGIPAMDLFTIVGWIRKSELPAFDIYLHTKYPGLPPEAIRNIEYLAAPVASNYGVSFDSSTQDKDDRRGPQ